MITAVDTNVLIDVFRADPVHTERSAHALRKCIREGKLVVCDIVWAELAALFPSPDDLASQMASLDVGFMPMTCEAATLAGSLWHRYRERNSSRVRVIADFLIASHAQTQCDRLLTRDRGFYRDYFADLAVLDPTAK